jgi:hypothetical protein
MNRPIPVRAQAVAAELVGHEEKNVRPFAGRFRRLPYAGQRHREQREDETTDA